MADTFAAEETKIVEFTTPFDFSAPTANITFNYTIYTTLNNETAVYTGNDTITGSFVSYYTVYMPDSIVYTGAYTNPYEILELADRPADIDKYWFYANENDATPLNNTPSISLTTPALYDTVVYWVVGRTKTGKKCPTKRVKVIINVFRPQYDLSTDELLYPVSYQCASSLTPNLQVTVTNQDTTSNTQIPVGTFNLNAQFTGTTNVNDVYTISAPISSLQQDTIINNEMALGSLTQNRIYQYSIYTSPVDPTLPVYTLNDTISGSMYFPALPTAPEALTYTVPYGGTQTVTPGTSALNHYYFYENATDDQPLEEGNNYTTEPIYAPTTYYYSGRIESDGFDAERIVGTGTTDHSNMMFNLAKGYSYAKMLYTSDNQDLGNLKGRIDSIYFWVDTAANRGMSIPVRFWLKDTTDVQRIGTNHQNINWQAETANATLVFDGELSFNNVGWVGFAVEGGYDYNGEGLLLFAEQDCGGGCLPPYGLYPVPQFSNTSTGNNKKVYQHVPNNNVPLSGAAQFQLKTSRINTKFKMNYTCESPKAPITINTTVPQHDVGVVAISTPVTENSSFTVNESVTVTLHNFGTQAASNFQVSYQLDDGASVTQNYNGSLAAGATANMTFNTACDLTSVYFPTPFRAYTSLASDVYHPNDTVTILLSKEDQCPSRPKSTGSGAHITNVSIAMLNNGTGAPFTGHSVTPGNGMYTDYTQTLEPELLILGQNYPLSVTHAFSNRWPREVYKQAYIDFNRNGVFDADELVLSTTRAIPGE